MKIQPAFFYRFIYLALLLSLGTTACTENVPPASTGITPVGGSVEMANPSNNGEKTPAATVTIYVPASPSSIPVILAARQVKNFKTVVYKNNSQANTLFLRGDVSILATGLSVGVDLFKNKAPVQMINSYVAGLSFLVTSEKNVDHFSQIPGNEITLPFEGSPIEEATQFLAEKDGVTWKKDLKPAYAPFESSVELLRQGKIKAAVLPEPFVTLVESQPGLNISIDYFSRWNAVNGSVKGYPQVGCLVKKEWANAHAEDIELFNRALAAGIQFVEKNPAEAAAQVKTDMSYPPEILQKSLGRTKFFLTTGQEMAAEIGSYYRNIGKPLDETFTPFFLVGKK